MSLLTPAKVENDCPSLPPLNKGGREGELEIKI